MCGIFGIISSHTSVLSDLVLGLENLEYRGYDSAGIAFIHENEIHCYKSIQKIKNIDHQVKKSNLTSHAGIGHTRWATHGKPTLENAHPHISHDSVAIVHNGIITNHQAIKSELEQLGYQFSSQTDSESITHLLHHLLKTHEPLQALEQLMSKVTGRYAIAVMLRDHSERIFGLSTGHPLIIGKEDHALFISSDQHSLQHCTEFLNVPINIPFYISAHNHSLDIPYTPYPKMNYPRGAKLKHNTLQEIYEQNELVERINQYWRNPTFLKKTLLAKNIIFIACGSSQHSALIAKRWLIASGVHVMCELASELKTLPISQLQDTLVIAISQSGETADTLLALESLLPHNPLHTISICNTPLSSLTRLCQTNIFTQAGKEIGVASTKAFSAQILTLHMLVQHLTIGHATEIGDHIQKQITQTLSHDHYYQIAAEKLMKYHRMYCIGRRALFPIALESALKIKELTYCHAEGVAAGELKHGPLALIDPQTPTLVIDDQNCPLILSNTEEIIARDGPVFMLSPHIPSIPNVHHIPCFGDASPLGCISINIATQLIAYHWAKRLKNNIDQPRNLAKSVTVE